MTNKINIASTALLRQDRRKLERSLKDAARAVEAAEHVWGLWADDVRMGVEWRYAESTDETAILDDPLYGSALDVGGMLRRLGEQLSEIRSAYDRVAKELPRD
jgi:hypothetical protein